MKVVLFANTDWYLYNFRRSLAAALREAGHEVILVSPPGQYGVRLLESGFRWIPAPMERRSLNPLREVALVLWLYRLLRRERVDLMHGFTIKCAVYGSLAGRLARVLGCVNAVAGMGYVFTSNDTLARLLRPMVSGLMRMALNGARARLILQNPDDLALFEKAALVDPSNIRLIAGSGVDCERFSPPEARARGRPFRVLLPARVLWDKGLAEFVEAARQLTGEGREIEFLIAGTPDPGNPASVPESTIREWVRTGVVRWLGHVEDMPLLLREVDVVALPSYREGLPKGLIEAGACGCALVSTDVPGCREVVSHEVDGLLVPPRNSKALAAAIARLHDNRELTRQLGIASRAKILNKFDERRVIAETLNVYHELI